MMSDFYKKNMDAIRSRLPLFADLIEKEDDVDWIDEFEAENGNTNIIIRTTKDPVVINNNKDPKTEARKKASENTYATQSASVVVGIGTGYYTKEILNQMEKRHVVLVMEPVIPMLKRAFKLNDFSEAIKRGDLLFAITRYDIDFQLSLIETTKHVENWVISIEDYTKYRYDEYGELREHTLLTINQLRSNTHTMMGAGAIMAENDILSLPYIIRHRGVKQLEGLYKDKPAILITTGPSLTKNVQLLMDPAIQEKFIIIAAGQALRALLAYDIKPDFVCSIDFGPVNWGHYKGLFEYTEDIPLVTINRSYISIVKHWRGPKFISSAVQGVENKTTAELIQKKGSLIQGGSVAHTNMGLAIALGCNPIIFIGQDLAWEGEKSHSPLIDEAGNIKLKEDGTVDWDIIDPRSEIKGKHKFECTQQVEGWYGKPVNTMSGYLSFKVTFENLFRSLKDSGIRFINATEGGIKLKGTEQMTLQEVIETHTEPIKKEIVKPLYELEEDHPELVKTSIKRIKKEIKDINDIIESSTRSLVLLDRMKNRKNKHKFAKRLKENYEIVIKCKRLCENNPPIAISVFWAGRRITHKQYSDARYELKEHLDENKKADLNWFYTKEGAEVFRIRMEANRVVMEAAKESAKLMLKHYETSLEELEYLDEHSCIKPFKDMNPPPSLEDVNIFYHNKNWAYPLIEARRILTQPLPKNQMVLPESLERDLKKAWIVLDECMYHRECAVNFANWNYDRLEKDKLIKYNQLLENAKDAGKEEKDLNKALDLLLEALSTDPDRVDAKWGLSTTFHGLGDDETEKGNLELAKEFHKIAINILIKLVEEHPDNIRLKFELALIYLRSGNGRGADELFNQVYSETDEFDFFLKGLAELYYKAGMTKEAKTTVQGYIEKFPNDPRGSKLLKQIEKEKE